MIQTELDKLIGHLFRTESGKMVSVLTRLLGFQNFQTAEDIVQETLLTAMTAWKFKGVPENPSAWMYTVAKRKAIDILRQQKVHQTLNNEIALSASSEWTLAPTVSHYFQENEIEDSQLRMMFASCHPAIPYESQLAFTLKTLCGLSIAEIAKSFLTNEETITKRLYRAREKIRVEKIELEFPEPSKLKSRLEAVHHVLYLLFNEGYNSSHHDKLIRQDLCEEAMRLTLILVRNPTIDAGTSNALLALMCLQAAREDSRLDDEGNIILLKDQDRSKWNNELIRLGLHYLELAMQKGDFSEYHIEGSIAACHATAKDFQSTDWKQIFKLYEALETFRPGAVTELNKAIALGFANSIREGLDALLKIDSLRDNHHYHSAIADFYVQLNQHDKAKTAYETALKLTSSLAEKNLLQKKYLQLT